MTPPQPLLRDEGFPLWRDRVDRLVRERLCITLDALPDLPLRDGYEAGDSPAEFVAGCVMPMLDEEPTVAS